jgi:methylenetetrahydrofolate dehydrogenase (NADP+)/methenyltetrahydrofolate cyclohydrolase
MTMAKILDGRALAEKIRKAVRSEIRKLRAEGVEVGLGVLKVGEESSSASYYNAILAASKTLGVTAHPFILPETASVNDILHVVHQVNGDERISGLLVLFPLPRRVNPRRVVNEIAPEKDVDGLGYLSIGRLAADESTFLIFERAGDRSLTDKRLTAQGAGFLPCTPFGVVRLLEHYGIPLKGAHAVVVGKSLAVGKPLAQMLLAKESTVTVCHKATRDLAAVTRQADVLCTATGVRGLIKAGMVKKGAAVIDIGINVLPDGRIVGDVDYGPVAKRAAYITPVPGGVGPVTIAMLLENTVRSAKRTALLKSPFFLG